jgi:hypothetical protein
MLPMQTKLNLCIECYYASNLLFDCFDFTASRFKLMCVFHAIIDLEYDKVESFICT